MSDIVSRKSMPKTGELYRKLLADASSLARSEPRLIVSGSRYILAADLDVPERCLDVPTAHVSVDEDVGGAVDERHTSEEEKVARDQNQTSPQVELIIENQRRRRPAQRAT
jgi:hypothetical protein